jgi:solute carrier family 25 thiamine pyrophosphate transporter 19
MVSSPTTPTDPSTATKPTSPSHPGSHWHDLIAGAAAGLGARAITAPLDLLKIRRQLAPTSASSSLASIFGGEWRIHDHLRSIAKNEGGPRSLFRGNVAASYLWMGYSMTEFWVYGHASGYLRALCAADAAGNYDVKVSVVIGFVAGAISGVCATVVTYPFDLCRTIFAARGIFPIPATNVTWSDHTTDLVSRSRRQWPYVQRRPPRTLYDFAREIYRDKGLGGFYAGIAPGLLQVIPYMGLNFALHDAAVMLSGSNDSVVSGVAGMGAGVVSKFLVYPLDTVKRRLQAQAFYGSSPGGEDACGKVPHFPKHHHPAWKTVPGTASRAALHHQTSNVVSYEGMMDCFKEIGKKEGVAAFYKGLIPSLLKSSISTGASFWLFTLTKNILRSLD